MVIEVVRRVSFAFLLVFVVAAGVLAFAGTRRPVDVAAVVQTQPTQPTEPRVTSSVSLEWSQVERTPACWFFSGPAPLGRDHRYGSTAVLVERGHALAMTFADAQATSDATFTDSGDDDGVNLRRTSTGVGYGRPWHTVETITGAVDDAGVLHAAYRYSECEVGADGLCAVGTDVCHIDALVTAR